MCGIAALLVGSSAPLLEGITKALSRRGPDATEIHEIHNITLIASVLSIQGENICQQPYIDGDYMLLWNGEVFNDSSDLSAGTSDTVLVAQALRRCCEEIEIEVCSRNITSYLSGIQGPFAFIYYDKKRRWMFYGRDPFGRRSLLSIRAGDEVIGVCSVAVQGDYQWDEIGIGGVHFVQLDTFMTSLVFACSSWPEIRIRLGKYELNIDKPLLGSDVAAAIFLERLRGAVSRRVRRISYKLTPTHRCTVGVLFSGGIDSVLLTVLLSETLAEDEPIDLINVTFLSTTDGVELPSPDRLAAIAAYRELTILFPRREFRLVHVDVTPEERLRYECHIVKLISPLSTHMDLNIGTAFWFASRADGYTRTYSEREMRTMFASGDTGRPLLRHGAEDAAKSVGLVPGSFDYPVELLADDLKVSCANDTCGRFAKTRCSLKLCGKCCHRRTSTEGARIKCPVHKSKIDRNPEEAIDAVGECSGLVCKEPYQSKARALLVGIGADEHLAGYGRHRTTFLKGGVLELHAELIKDQTRLWKRNLGRDDRCISDNGREAWFPFIDEELVTFLQSLNLLDIADLRLGQGDGDKKILRDAARLAGLDNCTCLVKRAIQFGTKIAKLTNVQYHGSNRRGKGEDLIDMDES